MPRTISKEEAQKIGYVPMGKKHPVRADLEMMKTEECLQITKQEFNWKGHTPSRFTNDITRKTGKTFNVVKMKNNNGWFAFRLT